jgi:hypothetical protein
MACSGPGTVETEKGGQIGLSPEESYSGRALFKDKLAGGAMKHLIGITAGALVACSAGPHAQSGAAPQPAPTPPEPSAPVADSVPASDGVSDLGARTFGCVKAGLNAAAREAAKVPSQGTYQFSYFKLLDESHHSTYEVHFKSNYQGEADLQYCVAIYCQQGWDPKTTRASVRLMSKERQPKGMATHGAECGKKPAPVKRRVRR